VERSRQPAQCVCGHDWDAHQHYRRGNECALCGCTRWRPRRWLRRLIPFGCGSSEGTSDLELCLISG